ncbi:hypothetical protein HDU76_005173 [Blyttiomyces sp. JEL0837]|nr:hypothetical protein HDU76_005173 [Blyttiomyces sp. JEL0837]
MLMTIDDDENKNPGLDVANLLMKIQTEFSNVMQQRFSVLKTDIKVGVAYGSIVAGIVGSEKFIYDIYSDTVNCEAYFSYDTETRSLWKSVGTHQVKGKGIMEIFTLHDHQEKFTNLPTPRSSQVWRTKAPSIRDSRLHTPNRVSPSQERNQRNSIAYEFKAQMKSLFSPAVGLANHKASEDRGLQVLELDGKGNFDGKSTRLDESRSDSRSLSQLEIGKFNAKITPLDTSRYLDSITTINMDESDAGSCPALHEIINNLSTVILTLTTDDLIPILSQYIDNVRVTFRDPQLEALYIKNTIPRLYNYVLHHATLIRNMMIAFVIIIPFYEAYLVGQVGYEIEGQIRNDSSQRLQESKSFLTGRFFSLGLMALAAMIQTMGVMKFRIRPSTKNNVTKDADSNEKMARGLFTPIWFEPLTDVQGSVLLYANQIFLLVLFGLPLICGTTYSKGWFAASALIPLLNCAVAFTTRSHINYLTRFILTISINFLFCLVRTLTLPMGYVEWLFAILSICTSMFIVYRTEYAERIGYLLEETFRHSQATFDRRAYLSAGLLKAVLPKRLISRLTNVAIGSEDMLVVERFKVITILHLDVVSFTVLSGTLEPVVLIALLNSMFSKFDQICRDQNVEKILTIGDAYVAAGLCKSAQIESDELPNQSMPTNEQTSLAEAVCTVGIDMQRAMSAPGTEYSSVQIRVGIHSGPASGFITGGLTKLKYELIGDTVDIAEKVQEKTTPRKVFASETTVSMLQQSSFTIQDVNLALKTRLRLFQIEAPVCI